MLSQSSQQATSNHNTLNYIDFTYKKWDNSGTTFRHFGTTLRHFGTTRHVFFTVSEGGTTQKPSCRPKIALCRPTLRSVFLIKSTG